MGGSRGVLQESGIDDLFAQVYASGSIGTVDRGREDRHQVLYSGQTYDGVRQTGAGGESSLVHFFVFSCNWLIGQAYLCLPLSVVRDRFANFLWS